MKMAKISDQFNAVKGANKTVMLNFLNDCEDIHFLVLTDTFGENVSLDKYIFKTFVLFLKSGVVGEEAVNSFRRGGNVARL